MIHRFLAALAVGAFSLALAPAARAYCRTTTCAGANAPANCGPLEDRRDPRTTCLLVGKPLYWAEPCTSFSVQSTGSPLLGLDYTEAESLVATAFSFWPAAACSDGNPSISVQSLGPVLCDRREYNPSGPNANAILFRDHDWPYDPIAIALTTVSFDGATGKILGADMEINSGGFALTDASLRYVVTHEAGHFLGLDHSPRTDAVMFANYSIQDPRVSSAEPVLSSDDIDGICATYPPARSVSAVCDPEPAKGFAADCGGDVVGSCAFTRRTQNLAFVPLLGGAALAFVFARRRSRRDGSPASRDAKRRQQAGTRSKRWASQ
jgi:hypothetical protein